MASPTGRAIAITALIAFAAASCASDGDGAASTTTAPASTTSAAPPADPTTTTIVDQQPEDPESSAPETPEPEDVIVVTRVPVLTAEPATGIAETDFVRRSENGGETVFEYPLDTTLGLEVRGVTLSEGPVFGNEGVYIASADNSLVLEGPEDEKLAPLVGVDFHNGTIEFDVNASVAPDTPEPMLAIARGFAGLCFRVAVDGGSFECFYIRAENGQADDPVRAGHAAQYISLPGFDFATLRREAPEKYESAAPVSPGQWHTLRIEVDDASAALFVDNGTDAVLAVDDLKLGADARGGVALWVGVFTDAFFRNLTITATD